MQVVLEKTTDLSKTLPIVSIVITVFNEQDNIPQVCSELVEALQKLPPTEIIFVDDGSTDNTIEVLHQHRHLGLSNLRILVHDRRCGKSTALRTGITAARGEWIATLDGDAQDDPRDLPELVKLACNQPGRPPLVVGIRQKRCDSLSKRIATRFANNLRQYLLQDHCPDTGGPIKVFRRVDFLRLPQFEGVHRYLPALFATYGVPLLCHTVTHRPRLYGVSKYTNFHRALVGVRDLLGVLWLRNRTHLPHTREC